MGWNQANSGRINLNPVHFWHIRKVLPHVKHRADSRFAPSQWETLIVTKYCHLSLAGRKTRISPDVYVEKRISKCDIIKICGRCGTVSFWVTHHMSQFWLVASKYTWYPKLLSQLLVKTKNNFAKVFIYSPINNTTNYRYAFSILFFYFDELVWWIGCCHDICLYHCPDNHCSQISMKEDTLVNGMWRLVDLCSWT